MIPVTSEQLRSLAPRPQAVYASAFTEADTVLAKYAINATPLRLAHFMAQVLHESGKLTILTESMNYSPEGMIGTFGKRRVSEAQAQALGRTAAHPANQRAIANLVYGGAWGRTNLGNTDPDDGWNFRGTGLLQMTGRDSRLRIGKALGVDLVGTPELALDPRHVLYIAAEEWSQKGCNPFADADDITRVTKLINGGNIGLDERKKLLVATKAVWVNPAFVVPGGEVVVTP
ncbi:MAG TPA: glycoside hydrolase family 19 protein [Thermoanaerobaculia bacterium]|jgi:putative chitinase